MKTRVNALVPGTKTRVNALVPDMKTRVNALVDIGPDDGNADSDASTANRI